MQENCQNFENYFLTEYTTVLTGTMSPRKVATSYSSQCEFELAKYTSKKLCKMLYRSPRKTLVSKLREKSQVYMKKKIKKVKILPDLLFNYES